jgi:hypothetical protein
MGPTDLYGAQRETMEACEIPSNRRSLRRSFHKILFPTKNPTDPSYETGKMRSRRGDVPGRTSPEERSGGGGEGTATPSPLSPRSALCRRVFASPLASWKFFHAVDGGYFFPDRMSRKWTG